MGQTTIFLTAIFGSALAAILLTPLSVVLARTLGIVDLPGSRKVHESPTPRIGGLALAVAFLALSIPLYFAAIALGGAYTGERARVATLLLCGFFLFVVGLVDDIINIPSKYKLLALIVASLAFCSSGAVIGGMSVAGKEIFALGITAWPLTVLWMVAVTVSVNFIDGLDGLAAGIVAIASGVLAIGAVATGNVPVATLALVLMGSLLGFLVFNFNPAKVFMGDCGSMFIGFTLAGCGVLLSTGGGSTRGILLPAICLAIPFADLVFTVIRRSILQRRSLFSAERGHIHHRMLDSGLAHRHAVLVLYAFSIMSGGVGLLSLFRNKWLFVGGALLLGPAVLMLFRAVGSVRGRETLAAIRRNRALGKDTKRAGKTFEEMQLRFRAATTFGDWWARVCEAAELLDFVSVDLSLMNRDGSPRVLKWRRSDELHGDCPSIIATLPIKHRRLGDPLSTTVEVASPASLESAGHRLSLFSRLMSEYSVAQLGVTPRNDGRTQSTLRRLAAASAALRRGAVAGESGLPDGPRVAVVHDFLYTYAGAEKVLEQILAVYPDAELFSLFDFLPKDARGFLGDRKVTTSFIQHLPWAQKKHRAYLPMMPLAIEQLDVSAYDIVISSSYCAAKGVITRPDQLHVCYCHTPVRFAWDMQHQYLNESGLGFGLKGMAARLILHYIRSWDARSANGVDAFVTNSDYVGRRIEKVYRRKSVTIYPPVDTESFHLGSVKEDFYVTASRMVPYKRMDLIIDAFSRMPDKRLVVIGEGPDFARLAGTAGPNVRLVGHQSADRLKDYLQMAKAFIFAAEEDFGIVPVEAQACGTPVIAFGRGGAAESIVPDETGVLFAHQTIESLVAAVQRFESIPDWDRAKIRRNAERFSAARFRDEFGRLVAREWARFQAVHPREQASTTIPHIRLADRPVRDAEEAPPLVTTDL